MAKGNTLLLPSWMTSVVEWLVLRSSPILDSLGSLVARLTGDRRWSYLGYHIWDRVADFVKRFRTNRRHSLAIEILNPTDRTVELVLQISVDRSRMNEQSLTEDIPVPFLQTLRLDPGHFSEIVPGDSFAAIADSGLPYEIALDPLQEDTHLVFLTLELIESPERLNEEQAEAQDPPVKCVIFDLDQTLWDGILIEGDIQLRSEIARIFDELDRRGILISVASKNDPEAAMNQLRAFGIDEYVLHPHIGWHRKSDGVKAIAKHLNIGTNALLFIDDSPFERAEVERAVPGVTTLPETALHVLLDHPRLTGTSTSEAKARRRIYKEAEIRKDAADSFDGGYTDFLRACDIQLEIGSDESKDVERIHELVQRTNQLNFSGHKYSPREIKPLLADPTLDRHVIECSDRYGAYGIVGFCLTRFEDRVLRVEDLMLSCRVQGKQIERALFAYLVDKGDTGIDLLEIVFNETDRNGPASAVLDELGFERTKEGVRQIAVTDRLFETDVITIERRQSETGGDSL
ncbi:MAG: HAD-IIIC family phosphatase [Parasphingopyxis sp.]|uniref:HAD-IIIC family phosphatase n=1 Tax=Parasphingopyxis sp. TaxID=1920299 RepID=UPI0032EC333A